jgi:hypothetical protein
MRILLPYDKKTIAVEIADRNFVGSLVSRVEDYKPGKSQQELVEFHRQLDPKLKGGVVRRQGWLAYWYARTLWRDYSRTELHANPVHQFSSRSPLGSNQ